jgi:PAS domain S-box-containing protein
MIAHRMSAPRIRILLIEDDHEDVMLLEEYLEMVPDLAYDLVQEPSLRKGITRAQEDPFDVVLVDLGLPDSNGMGTFTDLQDHIPHLPIIVLTGLDDREVGNRCVLSGAQDFLVKGKLTSTQLERSIWYSIDRKIAERTIIEERDRAEQYLKIAGVMILALDGNGDIMLINPKGVEILGYENEAEVLGMNWIEEFLPKDMHDLIGRVLDRCLAGEIEMVEYFENSIIRRDGTERLIAWHNSTIKSGDGVVIGTLSSGEDITDRTLAQAALERSEKRLKTAQNIARLGYWELDIRTDRMIWSDEVFRIFELDRTRSIGSLESFFDLIHPGDRAWVRSEYLDSIEKQIELNTIHRILLGDGTVKHVNERCRTLFDENGDPLVSLGTVQDITERVRMQERQALVGKILSILNRPNDWKILIRDILSEIKKTSGFEALGIRLREGEDFPYYVTNGFPESFVRKEKSLIARNVAGEIIRDTEGRVIHEGACSSVILGMTDPDSDFITGYGSFWRNGIPGPEMERSYQTGGQLERNTCSAAGYESVALIPLRSGSDIIGLLQINDRRRNMFTPDLIRFYEELGSSIGIAFKRKQAEEELVHLNTEIHMKNRELEQIVFASSHDIRSPLVNIQGFSSELRSSLTEALSILDEDGDPEVKLGRVRSILEEDITESLNFINKNNRMIDGLNSGLLQFSRLSSAEMSRSDLGMDALVASVLRKFEQSLEGYRVRIDPLPGCIGDVQFITQVVSNLIDNAIKFNDPDGDRFIEVTGEVVGATAEYRFRDSGIGIDPLYHEKIFDLFHRLEPDRTDGMGLGLTLVKRIMEKHEGDIRIESEPGKGTTIILRLPRGNQTSGGDVR